MTNLPDSNGADDGSLWPLLGWVIFALAAAALAVVVMAGGVMRAVVLDVVSFWPAWAVSIVLPVVLWAMNRKKPVSRIGAIAPLLLFSWLTGAVGLHFAGWDQLPSAAGDLAGPAVAAAATAELGIEISGELRLEAEEAEQLYEVNLVRGRRRNGAGRGARAPDR